MDAEILLPRALPPPIFGLRRVFARLPARPAFAIGGFPWCGHDKRNAGCSCRTPRWEECGHSGCPRSSRFSRCTVYRGMIVARALFLLLWLHCRLGRPGCSADRQNFKSARCVSRVRICAQAAFFLRKTTDASSFNKLGDREASAAELFFVETAAEITCDSVSSLYNEKWRTVGRAWYCLLCDHGLLIRALRYSVDGSDMRSGNKTVAVVTICVEVGVEDGEIVIPRRLA